MLIFYFLCWNTVLIVSADMDIPKKRKMRRDSNIEKMLPPRNSPRVPPMELRRSYIVKGSYLVTCERAWLGLV